MKMPWQQKLYAWLLMIALWISSILLIWLCINPFVSLHPFTPMQYGFMGAVFSYIITLAINQFVFKNDSHKIPIYFLFIAGAIGYFSLVLGNEPDILLSPFRLFASVCFGGMIGFAYAFCLCKLKM